MQYDIFISYRREGGDMMAHILYERLTQRGYSVFQDIESLRSGKFNNEIYGKIEQCKDFILILPPKALERCKEPDDWVKKEIVCALKNKKNIIPVMLRGFDWPKNLQEEIKDIKLYNGLVANTEYFEQFLDKLTDFLTSSISGRCQKNFKQKHSIRTVSLGVILFLILMLPIIVIYFLNQQFGLLWRIIYFIFLFVIAKIALYEIETRPNIAASCFGSLTEEDLKEIPDVLFSRVTSAFGKDIFISREKTEQFSCLYTLKRMLLGTWDDKKTNYLKIVFKRTLEWYDPSVFYLHSLSKGGEAVKMLTRQGFILQTIPSHMRQDVDYLIKEDFHVFLFYKKRKLDYIEIYHCSDADFQEKCKIIGEWL